jgi:hypothetical protein
MICVADAETSGLLVAFADSDGDAESQAAVQDGTTEDEHDPRG